VVRKTKGGEEMNPMTRQQYDKLKALILNGHKVCVFCDDLSGEVIQWGSEDNNSPDPAKFVDFLHPVHWFRVFDSGRTIEADPKGSQWHLLDEYMDRIISGEVRFMVFTDDPSPVELAQFLAEGTRQVGKPYGWGAILGFGLAKLFKDTFIGAIWRNNQWNTPWCDRNDPVCSQGVKLQDDNTVRLFYLYADLNWKNATPQALLDICIKKNTKLVVDSFAWAKLTA
jgi:hypothetical protein